MMTQAIDVYYNDIIDAPITEKISDHIVHWKKQKRSYVLV